MATPIGTTLQGVYVLPDGVTHVVAVNAAGMQWRQTVASPITLSNAWLKVASTTQATRGLILAATRDATAYDIEWVCVDTGASAPSASYGTPIFAAYDFPAGVAIGDVYAKSASGQKLVVNIGA